MAPDQPTFYFNRANYWQYLGKLELANADRARALDVRRDRHRSSTKRLSEITAPYFRGDHDRAIAYLTEAIRLNPRDAGAYSFRGFVWQQREQFDKAIADFSEAIRLNPQGPDAFNACYRRASAWASKQEIDEAIADLTKAIALDGGRSPFGVPLVAAAYSARGGLWNDEGEYDRAVADFTKAINLNPQGGDCYLSRGAAWRRMKQYDKALADFGEAVRLNPQVPDAYLARARIWASCPEARYRDGSRALRSAADAGELTGWRQFHCLSTLAAAFAEVGDFRSAVKWQAKANEFATDVEDRSNGESWLRLYHEKRPYREGTGQRKGDKEKGT